MRHFEWFSNNVKLWNIDIIRVGARVSVRILRWGFTTFCVFWAHTSWPSELGPQPITSTSMLHYFGMIKRMSCKNTSFNEARKNQWGHANQLHAMASPLLAIMSPDLSYYLTFSTLLWWPWWVSLQVPKGKRNVTYNLLHLIDILHSTKFV